jgi:hypothetical protein
MPCEERILIFIGEEDPDVNPERHWFLYQGIPEPEAYPSVSMRRAGYQQEDRQRKRNIVEDSKRPARGIIIQREGTHTLIIYREGNEKKQGGGKWRNEGRVWRGRIRESEIRDRTGDGQCGLSREQHFS